MYTIRLTPIRDIKDIQTTYQQIRLSMLGMNYIVSEDTEITDNADNIKKYQAEIEEQLFQYGNREFANADYKIMYEKLLSAWEAFIIS